MTVLVFDTDPSPAVDAAFRRIQRDRMAGVGLLHAGLQVQPVDFARWHGQWLGALVTPWFLNLVLVPGDAATWRTVAVGARVFHRFGAGDFAFLGNEEPELGEFQTCSLCSPMSQFPDQATACDTARMALRMLHVEQPAAALVGAPIGSSACRSGQDEGPAPRAVATAPATKAGASAPSPSRRTILFGGRAG